MTNHNYRSSQPDRWSNPRPQLNPAQRYMTYGKILPMEQPSLWQRLFGGR